MIELKCPNCGEVFTADEDAAASIIKQVRDSEFNKELDEYKKNLEKQQASAIELIKKEEEAKVKDLSSKKDQEITELQGKLAKAGADADLAIANAVAEKEKQLTELKAKAESDAVKAMAEAEKKIAELEGKLAKAGADADLAVANAVAEKEKQLTELKARAEADAAKAEAERAKAVSDAKAEMSKEISEKDKEILELKAAVSEGSSKNELALLTQKSELEAGFNEKLGKLNEELDQAKRDVEYYRDLKARMSTKMVGESLERHCMQTYDTYLRPLLPASYFEKDNELSETGSKGDFIYRENSDDGVEVLSIMFEMKNEMDSTASAGTGHTNESFFKELDKDRREKKCEYAVLVSLLEADNEYYNQGIVDVSHRYPKMYVIRPQFLVPMITLLRNLAVNTYQCKKELADYKAQNIDVTNFEKKLNAFKDGFTRSCGLTQKKFDDAIVQIDNAIRDLQKVKDALTMSGKHLTEADNKLEDLTVRRLTYGNPTMKAAFAEAAAAADASDKSTDETDE